MIVVGSRGSRFPLTPIVCTFSIFVFVFFALYSSPAQQVANSKTTHSLNHDAIDKPLPPHEEVLKDIIKGSTTYKSVSASWEQQPQPTQASLSLPLDYLQPSSRGSAWCSDRFEIPYLTNLSKTQTEYCDSSSTSSLRCFSSPTGAGESIDSFCIGGPALFDPQEKQFKLDCQLRKQNVKEMKRTPSLRKGPDYGDHPSSNALISQYVGMNAAAEHMSELAKFPRKFTILVRREQPFTNLWHELLEISSMYWTLDVLRMTKDKTTGQPFFSLEDVENTRVLILDEQEDGPYSSLWTMFARRPITRLSKVSDNDFRDPEHIILPLPGASNPMSQGDREVLPCAHSSLLDVFSNRVLDFCGVDRGTKDDNSPLVVTFIDRHEKRQLMDKAKYVQGLKRAYPDVEVQMIDFAALPFAEQLKVVRRTDVLVGVHGAGLAHSLFLPPGSAVVEILPAGFKHKGFRNLAKLRGHRYFSGHASSNGTDSNWQYDDLIFDKSRFMKLVNTAIASMYNRGLHNKDVV